MLTDNDLALRAPEPADLDCLYLWENDTSAWWAGNASAPLSRQLLWQYIDTYEADIFASRQLRMVIERAGERAGTVDLYDFDPVSRRAGVGIYVAASCRGTGCGGRALRLLEGYCRERLGMHQLWAVVPVDNPASRALFAGAGYRIAGRLQSWICRGGRYSDAFIYQKMLG